MNIFWIIMSILIVVVCFLLFIAVLLLFKTFKLLIKELYKQESNINYIKNTIESFKKSESEGKHIEKLFEDDRM